MKNNFDSKYSAQKDEKPNMDNKIIKLNQGRYFNN